MPESFLIIVTSICFYKEQIIFKAKITIFSLYQGKPQYQNYKINIVHFNHVTDYGGM